MKKIIFIFLGILACSICVGVAANPVSQNNLQLKIVDASGKVTIVEKNTYEISFDATKKTGYVTVKSTKTDDTFKSTAQLNIPLILQSGTVTMLLNEKRVFTNFKSTTRAAANCGTCHGAPGYSWKNSYKGAFGICVCCDFLGRGCGRC